MLSKATRSANRATDRTITSFVIRPASTLASHDHVNAATTRNGSFLRSRVPGLKGGRSERNASLL
jgi:hypothetical protein